MKNVLRMIAALLIAVMCLTGAALAAGKIKTTGDVNIRKGPGLDYATSGNVGSGKVFEYDKTSVDERGVKWYHVTGTRTGWISSKYAKTVDSSTATSNGDKVKATGDVNIRKGPGLDYKTVGSISSGSTAKYLFETKKDERGVKWYKVSYNGKTGWISSKYSKIV